jgi:penicillin-binding protein 1A
MVKRYNGNASRLRKPGIQGDEPRIGGQGGYVPDIIGVLGDLIERLRFSMKNSRVLLLGAAAGFIIAFIVVVIIDFYKVQGLANYQPNVTTKIFDKNGALVSELFRQKRDVVELKKIPAHLVNAFISMEDNEFYEHNGINIKGIVRAFFINIFSGKIKQGGSTITQQLSKILLTTSERSLYRKLKEAFIAIMMEMTYSKEEILDFYLNQIFLGHGAYGVESASRFYFDKGVRELNLAECALLATLPSAPNKLSPIRYPQKSMERHRVVLAKMVDMGYITIAQAEKTYIDFWPDYLDHINNLPPSYNTWSARLDKAPWFTEMIRRRLIKKYGEEAVYENGLLVYTTLDIKKQLAAQDVLYDALKKQSGVSASLAFKNEEFIAETYTEPAELVSLLFDLNQFTKTGSREVNKINNHIQAGIIDELEILNFLGGFNNIGEMIDRYMLRYYDEKEQQNVEGCIVSIDHRNGYIEALVGGSEFTSINQLNRAMQSKRQPGSAIKPLLYAAAMETKRISPATAILDSPIVYLDSEGGDWIPENYEGEYHGLVRLRKALAQSINVVSIRIAETLGIDYVLKYMNKFLHLDDAESKIRIPRNFSIAIGSFEVSPLELTRAYAIIANGGRDVIPFSVRYIKDRNGNILENEEDDVKKQLVKEEKSGSISIIRPETAQIMISMLRSVIAEGTARHASIGRPVGGKTGSTNNWKDAWFVGFTPQVTTGLWMGYDRMGLSLGIGQAAAGVAAPVWGRYMRQALKGEAVLDFPGYASLVTHKICSISGLNPTDKCKSVMDEVFIEGSLPEKDCDTCGTYQNSLNLSKKGPDENISQDQKESVLRNINKKKKKVDGSVLDNIGNDLLE